MFKKTALLSSVLLAFASTATFAANGEQGSGPSPYTECGIGASLFPNTSW